MSHWAELDANNKVIRVLVGDNNDPAGDEGYSWLVENLGGTWIQTSYNSKIRYNFAGIDYLYDAIDDAFIASMPECGHESLLLNAQKRWQCSECEAKHSKLTTL
jgi:hypothetical protein